MSSTGSRDCPHPSHAAFGASSLTAVNKESGLDSSTAAWDEQLFLERAAGYWAQHRITVAGSGRVCYRRANGGGNRGRLARECSDADDE